MNKKKNIILFIALTISIVVILIIGLNFLTRNKNFIELDYSEIKEMINNNEDFILCVSRKNCSHCQNYKPKLNDVANKYDIKIYYIDIDSFDENEYNEFKSEFSFDGATPTTIFFRNGIEKTTSSRIEGDVSKEKIVNKLKKNSFIN